MSMESFLAKLEKNNTRTFLLPTLQEEITYQKMDVIESSVNQSMPSFLAVKVLDAMKQSLNGQNPDADQKVDIEDKDIKELLVRATEMWDKLVLEPKLQMEDIVRVPSQDRIAWFVNAIAESQTMETERGGVLTGDEVATFPSETRTRRNSKRSSNS